VMHCGTDFSGLSTYGLTAIEREMSTPPALYMEYGPLYLYLTATECHLPYGITQY